MSIKASLTIFILLHLFVASSHSAEPDQTVESRRYIDTVTSQRADFLNNEFDALVRKHQINTLGVAVIKNQTLVWENQYGLQSEGVPASKDTLFNVASLTKTFTAETILRLAAQGKLDLDESIATYWVDPDVIESKYAKTLTARDLLSHQSGFDNWRYFSKDGNLKFNYEPGTDFSYSGEGFEYLAKYAEHKLDTPFEQLVADTVLKPLKLDNAFFTVDSANFARIAKPLDEQGKFYGYYCHPMGYCSEQGSYSAAANLVTTVSDYATFLISAMKGEGLTAQLNDQRNTMQGIQFTQDEIICPDTADVTCPTQLGYGLGWGITKFGQGKLIGHRGTNWTVVSIAYFYPDSGDGLVVFVNGPNKAGIAAMVDVLERLDPNSPELPGYKLRLQRDN
ncbi:serine hydrolase domain-containing protein [Thalassotalea sp. PS06]|uniref:serine hydrolase domain-containing protein n=1 Tax=Thalassotalea sp. PS06 TaxID=2594005 RepID=UPI0011632C6C|nr:serine hydrolase domain-containing protein [Thalassotalea sp. PS06]QDP01315.1 beta-lactamase family protein [Thalassotalea sp. PS06]